MKFISEYRNQELASKIARNIAAVTTQPHCIMEICGGQTHAIMKYNLTEILPDSIALIHGPGCPVCVTPLEMVDKAITLATQKDVILTSFGDMMRVPGSHTDLLAVRASGGDVRMVFSPLDAVNIAVANPGRKVVFLAIGFETTAPANALAVIRARHLELENFSMLCSHVLVPPALRALLSDGDAGIEGLLAPGHVCTVTGYEDYIKLSNDFSIPITVTGFEPVDILRGIEATVAMLEQGSIGVENRYERSVVRTGNKRALETMYEVFEVCDRQWRGIGLIPGSGLRLRKEYSKFNAELLFGIDNVTASEPEICIAGKVLRGTARPDECPAFGKLCHPEKPLGAPMVSSEGACAAWYKYKTGS